MGSLETSLINCKVELKIKWTKYCVLAAAGNGHTNANPDNIVLTIKDTNLHVSVVFLSVKNKQKLLKRLSKGFERSVYWNEHKTENENENTRNKYILIYVSV